MEQLEREVCFIFFLVIEFVCKYGL
jgi:hypothetical protein